MGESSRPDSYRALCIASIVDCVPWLVPSTIRPSGSIVRSRRLQLFQSSRSSNRSSTNQIWADGGGADGTTPSEGVRQVRQARSGQTHVSKLAEDLKQHLGAHHWLGAVLRFPSSRRAVGHEPCDRNSFVNVSSGRQAEQRDGQQRRITIFRLRFDDLDERRV